MNPEEVDSELAAVASRAANEALMGYAPGTFDGVKQGAWNAVYDVIDAVGRAVVAAVYDRLKAEGAREMLVAAFEAGHAKPVDRVPVVRDEWFCPYDTAKLLERSGAGWAHFHCASCNMQWQVGTGTPITWGLSNPRNRRFAIRKAPTFLEDDTA